MRRSDSKQNTKTSTKDESCTYPSCSIEVNLLGAVRAVALYGAVKTPFSSAIRLFVMSKLREIAKARHFNTWFIHDITNEIDVMAALCHKHKCRIAFSAHTISTKLERMA